VYPNHEASFDHDQQSPAAKSDAAGESDTAAATPSPSSGGGGKRRMSRRASRTSAFLDEGIGRARKNSTLQVEAVYKGLKGLGHDDADASEIEKVLGGAPLRSAELAKRSVKGRFGFNWKKRTFVLHGNASLLTYEKTEGKDSKFKRQWGLLQLVPPDAAGTVVSIVQEVPV
jgi:hypothetical protein